MTRKLMLASAIAAALTGHPALALELGALRTDSALNQPFLGEIDVGDVKPDEIDALRVSIASPEAFEKAGIERYHFLTQLRFTPEATPDGRVRVRVFSQEPVREPYLDFLVQAVWPQGRLVKQYTVLLDPPLLTERRAPNVRPARAATAASGSEPGLPPVASGPGGYIPAPGEGFPLYIGPVGNGEGLWSLARRYAPAGATDAQTAMALYRSNQDAFIRGNINRLIAGKTLVIPSRAELFALSAEEARREFQAALRGHSARRAPITDVTPETLARLRLVGATPGTSGTMAPRAPTAAVGAGTQSQDVLLAIETSESARQETLELRNRIQELESQLAALQSLLQVRNAELARAQSVESTLSDAKPESGLGLEPIETPKPPVGLPEPLVQETELPVQETSETLEPVSAETGSSDLRSPPTEDASATREPEPGLASEHIPEPTLDLEPAPESAESETTIGLVPVPIPTDSESQVAPESSASTSNPAPVARPNEPEPFIEPKPAPSSTWHSLLLPLAGLAGVTALGILLFSLLMARRRQQQASSASEDALDSGLVLDLYDTASASEGTHASPETVSLSKTAPASHLSDQPISTPAAKDREETKEQPISDLTGFDAETDEADVLSEADIYIAYGRYTEAQALLDKELKRYPQRLDIKYKLAEAFAASGNVGALRNLLDEIRASGGDTADPAQWERIQRRLSEIAPNVPLAPASPSTTPASLAAAGAAAAASQSMPEPESRSKTKSDSDDDLRLDLGSSEPLVLGDAGSRSSDDSLRLELDSGPTPPSAEEIEQAIQLEIDSILPLPDGLDLDLGALGETPAPAADTLGRDLPSLDDRQDDLRLDLKGQDRGSEPQRSSEPPILVAKPSDKAGETLEPLDVAALSSELDSGLSPEQDSVPSDLLSSQWQIDSGIWDETATKLDLARAYVEMDDKDAAREILEEVLAEGREEQRKEARALLERLGS